MDLNSFEIKVRCMVCKSENVDVKIIDTNSTPVLRLSCNECKRNRDELKLKTEIAMKQVYWDIIEQSKQGANFNSQKQFDNLFDLLKNKDKKFIREFEEEWSTVGYLYVSSDGDEFNKLHVNYGGIVDGSDDFYMEFPDWLVSQGEELFKRYLKYGYQEVINYIKTNNIQEEDYTFENMGYVFQYLAKYKGYEYLE